MQLKQGCKITFHFNVCFVFVTVLQQQKNLEGYVGFASLPNQVYRKSVKRGFEFTLMVVGKNTRCSALCLLLFYMNHFIVFLAVGILKPSTVVCFSERERLCVGTVIFIHQGHAPSFVVLIAESERRGTLH